MRFNFISTTADGMGFALRILEEGNAVRIWIDDHNGQSIGDGLVPKVGDIEDLVYGANRDSDIFVFDTSGNGVMADGLRSQGYYILGASVVADRLEKDRRFAMEIMEECGIESPESFTFKEWDKAIEFSANSNDRLVYKPSKRLGELAPSYVSYDSGDMVEFLTGLKDKVEVEDIEFDLQTFVKGLEISSEGWFNGDRWLPLFNHTFERKQLMPGNLGPSGGCTGNTVWGCDGECPICRNGVRRLEKFLRSVNYKGMIDLNAILSEGKLYGLEFTPRFGYDASPTMLCGILNMELGQFFADLAMGQGIQRDALSYEKFASAIKVTIPPWPTEKYLAESDIPVGGLEPDDEVYWYNVKRGSGSAPFVSAGAWGIICLLLGTGSTVATSFTKPYKVAERLRLPDKQYRLDLVQEFKKNYEELEALVGL